MSIFSKMSWRYKLPIIIGVIFLLLSVPFLIGFLDPSIHEGRMFSVIYILLNLLPIFILGGVGDRITYALFGLPTLEQANLVFIAISLIFWIIVSCILGIIIDVKKGWNKSDT